jgi:hypothetical protein
LPLIKTIISSKACLALLFFSFAANAQNVKSNPQIHLIWFGGDDCPPCVIWRRQELPKLQESAIFNGVKFSYVEKIVRSSVPPVDLLPAEVKTYKQKLDEASSGRSGSPQAAVMVNGQVYDYFHMGRFADDIELMIVSIRSGSPYPFKRCLKMSKDWGRCELAVAP